MKLVLHYFELPGKGETTRLILTAGGIEFTVRTFNAVQATCHVRPVNPWQKL
jgi:hypothetical protein